MKISDITNNIKTIEKQKGKAKEILSEVSEFFEFALIAGGAPRNWAYNRSANDFDIYVCRRAGLIESEQNKVDKKITDAVKCLSKKYGFGENRAATGEVVNSNPYGGFILNSLYDFKTNEQECQLIVIDCHMGDQMKDLESFASRIYRTYDFGICMTAMDKDGNMYNDPMFEDDIKNKTFTCRVKEFRRNNNAGLQKLVERFNKMENYFPDHKMRIVE